MLGNRFRLRRLENVVPGKPQQQIHGHASRTWPGTWRYGHLTEGLLLWHIFHRLDHNFTSAEWLMTTTIKVAVESVPGSLLSNAGRKIEFDFRCDLLIAVLRDWILRFIANFGVILHRLRWFVHFNTFHTENWVAISKNAYKRSQWKWRMPFNYSFACQMIANELPTGALSNIRMGFEEKTKLKIRLPRNSFRNELAAMNSSSSKVKNRWNFSFKTEAWKNLAATVPNINDEASCNLPVYLQSEERLSLPNRANDNNLLKCDECQRPSSSIAVENACRKKSLHILWAGTPECLPVHRPCDLNVFHADYPRVYGWLPLFDPTTQCASSKAKYRCRLHPWPAMVATGKTVCSEIIKTTIVGMPEWRLCIMLLHWSSVHHFAPKDSLLLANREMRPQQSVLSMLLIPEIWWSNLLETVKGLRSDECDFIFVV